MKNISVLELMKEEGPVKFRGINYEPVNINNMGVEVTSETTYSNNNEAFRITYKGNNLTICKVGDDFSSPVMIRKTSKTGLQILAQMINEIITQIEINEEERPF